MAEIGLPQKSADEYGLSRGSSQLLSDEMERTTGFHTDGPLLGAPFMARG